MPPMFEAWAANKIVYYTINHPQIQWHKTIFFFNVHNFCGFIVQEEHSEDNCPMLYNVWELCQDDANARGCPEWLGLESCAERLISRGSPFT